MAIQTPFSLLSPEMLAQMAQQSFRPPQGMSMPSMPQQQPQQPGFNVGGAIAALGAGLDGWKPQPSAGGAPGPGAQPGEDRATAPQWPPPVAGAQPAAASGGPLTMPDFFNSSWWQRLGLNGTGGGGHGGGGGFYP